MRLLVTGTAGQVARALKAREGGDLEVALVGRPQLDLAEAVDLTDLFAAHAPDVVVSAAAYTQVDKAEAETALAFKINADGAGAVARAAAAVGAPVIHLSTDYVFDGSAPRPLTESEPTGPVNAYGASKLAANIVIERYAASIGIEHACGRIFFVYGPGDIAQAQADREREAREAREAKASKKKATALTIIESTRPPRQSEKSKTKAPLMTKSNGAARPAAPARA